MPLLHGRRRYLLASLSLAVPLQFPQALVVQSYRSPITSTFRAGLLVSRAILGLTLGFANINCISVLLDLFGASLQSEFPHQEIVIPFDPRRHGGGLGLWLGFWTWCSIGSLAIGFWIGASVIETLNPAWGFYIVVIFAASFLLLNVLCPETRRAQFRRTLGEFVTEEEQIRRRVARGEVKLHISQAGPKWWYDELIAGLVLMKRMLRQSGFLVLAVFTAWTYAQIVLIIVVSKGKDWALPNSRLIATAPRGPTVPSVPDASIFCGTRCLCYCGWRVSSHSTVQGQHPQPCSKAGPEDG